MTTQDSLRRSFNGIARDTVATVTGAAVEEAISRVDPKVRRWLADPAVQDFIKSMGQGGGGTVVVQQQETPFSIIGVEVGDSLEMIEAVYKVKRKFLHPDVPGTGNADRFKKLQEAYNAIKGNRM
jgi:hypothetical protein